MNCGGWNCRHQLVPVAKEAIPKNEKEALPYRNNPDYTDVKTNKQGGMKATHVGHIKHSATKEETFFDEKITSTELEKECQNILFKEGNSAILLQEEIKRANGTEAPALDIKLNGEKIDIRSITQECDTYRNALNAKNKQIKKFLKEYPTEKVESVCLYFHDPKIILFVSHRLNQFSFIKINNATSVIVVSSFRSLSILFVAYKLFN